MGSCLSRKDTRTAEIDEMLNRERRSGIKLLLLGAGESGKSTVLKQIRMIHQQSLTTEDLAAVRPVVQSNALQSLLAILHAMAGLHIPLANPELESDVGVFMETVRGLGDSGAMSEDLVPVMERLWVDEGVQDAFTRASEFQLNDSAKYFLDNVARIGARDYLPSVPDYLRCRCKTTGIVDIQFSFKDVNFHLFDVGGQRTERKKWIHCFDDVTAIIFVAAVSEYDQLLREDEKTNRLHESLTLFESVCCNQFFVNTSMILFLNKRDLLEEKIVWRPLTICFPEYEGPQTYEDSATFIQEQFESKNRNEKRDIYSHLTCATDTQNVQFVFDAVTDVIIAANLKDTGLI